MGPQSEGTSTKIGPNRPGKARFIIMIIIILLIINHHHLLLKQTTNKHIKSALPPPFGAKTRVRDGEQCRSHSSWRPIPGKFRATPQSDFAPGFPPAPPSIELPPQVCSRCRVRHGRPGVSRRGLADVYVGRRHSRSAPGSVAQRGRATGSSSAKRIRSSSAFRSKAHLGERVRFSLTSGVGAKHLGTAMHRPRHPPRRQTLGF